jgi:cysteinyl-tRNA synthetase
MEMRVEAKAQKNWALSDKIRNDLNNIGIEIKDTKDGYEWKLKSLS